ncbi:hypothetical protein ASPTUDRAFT_775446 [Aspergillus tubingensis CBS 134.48]|uniref:Uncharacterized protein n=1 Tax=Aspergillus tubingensis (strain CBS 134.48) TaxID=767770 RepID=A0A1L9MZ89_ASPTC|nr:hypothetical protein ASPTUDRAFT_775446 [Aspergillus tubingensis CBS 134.48]
MFHPPPSCRSRPPDSLFHIHILRVALVPSSLACFSFSPLSALIVSLCDTFFPSLCAPFSSRAGIGWSLQSPVYPHYCWHICLIIQPQNTRAFTLAFSHVGDPTYST